jgi:shikimate kinase
MTGTATIHGAGTVVNAMATGRGAAFGLAWTVTATVQEAATTRVLNAGVPLDEREARLSLTCLDLLQSHHPPLEVHIETRIPSKKGLKTSSAVALAVLAAHARHLRRPLDPQEHLQLAAEAGLRSRTSRTGAYDDAAACLFGGLVLTHNHERRLIAQRQLPANLSAIIHIPQRQIATRDTLDRDLSDCRAALDAAFDMATAGHIPQAMAANTRVWADVFDIDDTFTHRATKAGAWAAGITGKGPAQIALVAPRARADVLALEPDLIEVPLAREPST